MNKKNLKICFLSQEFSKNCNGGICRYTYDLAYMLAKMGNEVHVITKSNNNREKYYIDKGVHIHYILPENIDFLNIPNDMTISKNNLSYSFSACLKLLSLIEKFKIQIVEAPLWDAEGFAFSLIKNIPLIIRLETPLFKVAEIQNWNITKDLKFANWMEGETIRRSDKAIAISRDIGNMISIHHSIPKKHIELCPLGIKLPDENLLKYDKKGSALNVLFVGRLEKRKGIETLFKAIPKIIKNVPNVEFLIIGKDTNLTPNGNSYKKYLLSILDEKYHKNVMFLGYVDNIKLQYYYKKCDVFVAPSIYESFGLIFLEAMAWGKPVIGCNVGGVPEIVENKKDGILIKTDDENMLADAIIELLNDEKKRIEFGVNGRKKVEENFSVDKMAENTYNIYTNVLAYWHQ